MEPRGRRPTRRRRSWPRRALELDDRRRCGVGCRGAQRLSWPARRWTTDRAELARLTAEQDRLQAAFDATNEGSGGILLRLEALDRLGDKNGTLAAAQFMLALLFMSVEILPVLMKLLLNFSPPSAYDRLAALRDAGDVEIEELAQESRRDRGEGEGGAAGDGRAGAGRPAEGGDHGAPAGGARGRRRRAAPVPTGASAAEPSRPLWDTGPIRELARNAAVRTVRSVRRRPADRVPAAV